MGPENSKSLQNVLIFTQKFLYSDYTKSIPSSSNDNNNGIKLYVVT